MPEKNTTEQALSPNETLDKVADALHDRSILSFRTTGDKFDEAVTNSPDPAGTKSKK